MPDVKLAVLAMVGTTVSDGGLLDSALARVLAEQGIREGSPEHAAMVDYARRASGTSKLEVFARFFPEPGRAEEANRSFERHCDGLIGSGAVQPIPGAEEAIGKLRAEGIHVCLATGFGRHTQNTLLEALGWMGLADLSLCPADAGRGRPYPDMVLTAVLALDLDDVRNVAVVGDSTADMRSGLSAGAGLVAGVLTGAHDEATLRAAGAAAVVPSIADVPHLLSRG
ncbi:HAD family hydrolase [Pseudarthrobacter sp. J75]|uniref:HAD family hydrolase n=1 Tax=Pseudarthrobacter sp. J75 TaxID=3116486 RepID=UPI002E80F837|nr:HAD family hydrolase [Pseudarthrobacter sp. J75]MEE2522410.1 HAD family hydrolase [Pseudarthrobacter sp. J47]MEE2529259.1 HAD family hydrolase [Pseudarthrobacter sp. J75]